MSDDHTTAERAPSTPPPKAVIGARKIFQRMTTCELGGWLALALSILFRL
jgi:hypothetical protein